MTTNIQSFSGDVEIAGNLSVPSGITGVASSATKLETASNIALTGDVTGTASFDGSTNISIATTRVGGFDPSSANPIAIGVDAGVTNQGTDSVAIGTSAGQSNQGSKAIAIGFRVGSTGQSNNSVAIGYETGQSNQGISSVAIGMNAGRTSQGTDSVAIGRATGDYGQGQNSVAIGNLVGYFEQGKYSIAIGTLAGQEYQGSYSIAIGAAVGMYEQPARSFYVSRNSVRHSSGGSYLKYNTSSGEVFYLSSDDRVKDDETVITGAVKTLSKLRPQNYLKRTKLDPYAPEQNWNLESGFMAQEVYYSAPELRHIVGVPPEAGDIEKYTPPPSDDPTQDPDYSVWGDGIATVDYMQMVPYLVKAVQEIVTELPRSKTTVSNTWGQNITGCVVSANANSHKTNTTPIVALSNVYMDKAWYGVVSVQKTDTNDYDTLVNTNGDTQIWVTDVGGSLESGDLVTTSNVAPGYTQKQCDDLLRSSTVAKVTQDCDFTEPMRRAIKIPKRELSNVTYYVHDESYQIGLYDYERRSSFTTRVDETPIYFKEVVKDSDLYTITRYYEGETEVSEMKYETLSGGDTSVKHLSEISVEDYNTLDDIEKATYSMGTSKKYISIQMSKSKKQIPQHDEEIVVQELVDVFDENGQIVWEETGETEPMYTLVDHGTYKAALVSAKLV